MQPSKDYQIFQPSKSIKSRTDNLFLKAKEAMIDLCDHIYHISQGNERGVRDWLITEYKLTQSTVSKMYTVGFIVNNATFNLPNEYTKIYALAPVKEQLVDFNNYLIESDTDLEGMTGKEITESIKHFFGEETKTDERLVTSRKVIYAKIKTLSENFNTYTKKDVQKELEHIVSLMERGCKSDEK